MVDNPRKLFGWAFLAMILIVLMEIWAKIKHPAVVYSPVLLFWEVAALVLFFLVWQGIWPPDKER